ncbi:MAG: SDR family NAD(P)-dependent oxidoreductase [Deltaproteobacteria bacterium]|nr:SDR family NAD(P)-dependent oxidoreductase [Deltaproteobacteria bacterium]
MEPKQDMQGRVCLVTGATSGHGRALARLLADRGADLVLLGRNPERCRETQQAIARAVGREPRVLLCDLARRTEIDRAAEEFLSWDLPLHVLLDNAGLVSRHRKESPDGSELTLAVNYLAPFQLTLRLLPCLARSAPARIVLVASDAHRVGRLDFDDLDVRRRYWFWKAYAQSKLALVHFNRALARRLEGTGVTVNACDPGPIASRIADREPGMVAALASKLLPLVFPAPERAARTALHLATDPLFDRQSGAYWRFMKRQPPSLGRDPDATERRLWELSVTRTGAGFPRLG